MFMESQSGEKMAAALANVQRMLLNIHIEASTVILPVSPSLNHSDLLVTSLGTIDINSATDIKDVAFDELDITVSDIYSLLTHTSVGW